MYNQGFNFVKAPMEFNKSTERDTLQYCLGATLYMPGTKDIREKVINHELPVTSFVMCCEDAIKEEDLPVAEQNILDTMDYFADQIEAGRITQDDIPLIFMRVRNPEQFKSFAARMTKRQGDILTGFNFPKFNSKNALGVLRTLVETNARLGVTLYGMPILEGEEIFWNPTKN